jgi:hypothetical protein
MGIEPIWSFYPKFWTELLVKTSSWVSLYMKLRKIYVRIKRDPKRYEYTDLAITPVMDDELDTHEMFQTQAGQAYVKQEQRLQKIRDGHGHDHAREPMPVEAAE